MIEYKKDMTVYFVNDLTEHGGKIFIMKARIERIENNWIKLYNGHYHRPNKLFAELETIPNYETLELRFL